MSEHSHARPTDHRLHRTGPPHLCRRLAVHRGRGLDRCAAADGAAWKIAFAGRSNVGKSSLINALTGRNALARTSHTPGRTQELIFFQGPPHSALRLVDMPGYGYASAPKAKIAAWTELIHGYLQGRANLGRVYVLIDGRHGFKDADLDVLKTFDRAAVSYQIVLTKADQVKQAELDGAHRRDARRRSPGIPPPFPMSSPRHRKAAPAWPSCGPPCCGCWPSAAEAPAVMPGMRTSAPLCTLALASARSGATVEPTSRPAS